MSDVAKSHGADEIDEPRILRDFVCTCCDCACDDLVLTIEGDRIAKLSPPCPIAEGVYLQAHQQPMPPAPCLIAGQPAELAQAINRALEILRASNAPLVMGMERAACNAQRAAVALADRLGAIIDPTDERGRSRSHAAVQTVGAVTATLGEVAARADLIVYWNADPLTSDPRHMERFARRLLTARGTEGLRRRVVAVATARNRTAEASDEFLQLRLGGEAATLAVLRSLVRGIAVDESAVLTQTGARIEQWTYLAERMKLSQYVAIFHQSQQQDAVTELVRDLHHHTRAVALTTAAPPNAAGAAQVLAWQTGFPSSVDFGAGYPQHRPDEASAIRLIERGEVDAALVLAADPAEYLSGAALVQFRAIPTIAFDHRETKTTKSAAVAFFTPCFSWGTDGEIYRSDGVVLPLRAAIPSKLPAMETILDQMIQSLADR